MNVVLLRIIEMQIIVDGCAAIYGKNFCASAQRAFRLITSNALRVAAINSVGDFVLFLGKVAVVVAVVFAGIALVKVVCQSRMFTGRTIITLLLLYYQLFI